MTRKKKRGDQPSKISWQNMRLSDLTPASYNPRSITEPAFQGLGKSIEKFGLVQPIVWNKRTKRMVGGHQRLKVLEAQGAKSAHVAIVDLSPIEEKALNVALNSQAISGEFTADLGPLLKEIAIKTPDAYKDLLLVDLESVVAQMGKQGDEFPKVDDPDPKTIFMTECPKCGHKFPK